MRFLIIALSLLTFINADLFSQDVIYVSANGDNENNGFNTTSPIPDLQHAVKLAYENNSGEIKIHGDFQQETGNQFIMDLSRMEALTISGGWDENFTIQSGYSILNGKEKVYSVIHMESSHQIQLEGLLITGGESDQYYNGGGIFGSNISGCSFDCIISNNYANAGGGLYFTYSSGNTISGEIIDNSAEVGGGINFDHSTNNTLVAEISYNSARYAGGIYVGYSAENLLSGNIHNNTSVFSGGGIYLESSMDNIITGDINANTALDTGGGICFQKRKLKNNNDYHSATLSDNTPNNIGID